MYHLYTSLMSPATLLNSNSIFKLRRMVWCLRLLRAYKVNHSPTNKLSIFVLYKPNWKILVICLIKKQTLQNWNPIFQTIYFVLNLHEVIFIHGLLHNIKGTIISSNHLLRTPPKSFSLTTSFTQTIWHSIFHTIDAVWNCHEVVFTQGFLPSIEGTNISCIPPSQSFSLTTPFSQRIDILSSHHWCHHYVTLPNDFWTSAFEKCW